LEAKGYAARGGQMVDATIVPVPKQRNSRDENEDVKAGKTPRAGRLDTRLDTPPISLRHHPGSGLARCR
jgi:hypothetical protein